MFNRNSPLDVTDAYGLKGSGFGSTIGDLCKKLWNFPNTIIGVTIGVIGLPFGGSGPTIGNNAIQFPDNPSMVLGDITLGNSILYNEEMGPNKDDPNNFGYTYGDHEHQHTFQGETLGPLYLPANLIGGVISLFTTGNWHDNNFMETGPSSSPPKPW